MTKTRHVAALILLGIGSWSCVPDVMTPQSSTQPPTRIAPTAAPPASVPPTVIDYPGCYYSWATRELPDLSHKFSVDLQSLDMSASGSAYAFGEDCVHSDGSRSFSAMETDFRARVQVKTLEDEASMGDWIRTVMMTVLAIPSDEVPGAHPGRVEFEFFTPGSEVLHLNVDIARYQAEGAGASGAALFRMFHVAP